jgi:hypothetical protein
MGIFARAEREVPRPIDMGIEPHNKAIITLCPQRTVNVRQYVDLDGIPFFLLSGIYSDKQSSSRFEIQFRPDGLVTYQWRDMSATAKQVPRASFSFTMENAEYIFSKIEGALYRGDDSAMLLQTGLIFRSISSSIGAMHVNLDKLATEELKKSVEVTVKRGPKLEQFASAVNVRFEETTMLSDLVETAREIGNEMSRALAFLRRN